MTVGFSPRCNFAIVVGFNPAKEQGGISIMWKKFVVLGIVVFGIAVASSANAGTEVVRDYGGREVNQYAPPPPPPVYYAPPPVGVVVYPTAFFGPRLRFVAVRRFDGRRFPSRFHHFH